MRIVRLVAIHVTATTMIIGGIVLAVAGPALVVALGVAIAVVGVGYLYAELSAERAMRQLAGFRFPAAGSASTSELSTAPASARNTTSASPS